MFVIRDQATKSILILDGLDFYETTIFV